MHSGGVRSREWFGGVPNRGSTSLRLEFVTGIGFRV